MKVCKLNIQFFIFLSFILQACSPPSNQQTIEFPSEAMLTIRDLPKGWHRESIDFDQEVPNAESITVYFVGSTNPRESHILVSHQLSAYVDEESAQSAFPEWQEKWLSSESWKQPENWAFTPKDSDDIIEFGCLNQTINEKRFTVCTFLQLHKNLISLVLANIDGETLTIPEFEEAMKILDARLNQEVP
jgi:hypothetical protein